MFIHVNSPPFQASGQGLSKKLFMILLLTLILCFMVGCQDKEALAELEESKAQAEVEEQNMALFKRSSEAWLKEDIKVCRFNQIRTTHEIS